MAGELLTPGFILWMATENQPCLLSHMQYAALLRGVNTVVTLM
jgi:hypothetical protein